MSELTVIARAKVKPGQEPVFESAMREVARATHSEPGCLRYAIHRGVEDPSTFVVVERWKSKSDLDQHLASAHVQAFFGKIQPLLAGAPEITAYSLMPEGEPAKGTF